MDKQIELTNLPEAKDLDAEAELVEVAPESLQDVAGGQNGVGTGPPR